MLDMLVSFAHACTLSNYGNRLLIGNVQSLMEMHVLSSSRVYGHVSSEAGKTSDIRQDF
jgi:hypothetical protein